MQSLTDDQAPALTPPVADSGKTLLSRVEDSLLPLINLVFLLLMFFIAVGQMSATPLPDLPGSESQHSPQTPQADLVFRADGILSVDGKTVTETGLMAALPAPDDTEPLRIAADQSIAMADMEALFHRLESSGYKDIILLVKTGS